jgi:hypothetical protein
MVNQYGLDLGQKLKELAHEPCPRILPVHLLNKPERNFEVEQRPVVGLVGADREVGLHVDGAPLGTQVLLVLGEDDLAD